MKKSIALSIALLASLGLAGCGGTTHHTTTHHPKTHKKSSKSSSSKSSSSSSFSSSSSSSTISNSQQRNAAATNVAPQSKTNQAQGTQQYTAQGHYPTWKVGNVYYAKLPDGTAMQQTFADGDDPGSYQGNPEVQRETDQLQDQWAKEHGLNN